MKKPPAETNLGGTEMTRFASFALSALTATALAITPLPAAAADTDDIAGVIAGAVALGIIAKAIDDRNDRKKRRATEANARITTQSGRVDRYGDDWRRSQGDTVVRGTLSPWRKDKGPKAGRGYKSAPLPAACLRSFDNGRHTRPVYGARCLQRDFKFADKLPRACAFQVEAYRGLRTVYGARCLERDGWRVAHR